MTPGRQGPLTWGQELLWLGYLASPPDRRQGHTVVQRFAVPAGTTVADVAGALDALVSRHESLRTTYHQAAQDYQLVHPPRPVRLQVLQTSTDAADALVLETTTAMRRHAFDLAEPDTVRACVVVVGNEPKSLLIAVHHIAVDGWSWVVLRREFAALVQGTPLPTPAWQPLDQAADERSARGRRLNEAALRYWDRQLSVMPDRVLPGPAADGLPDQRIAVLDSARLATALAWLGQRHQVTDSTLLLGMFAALLGAVTGRPQSVVMTMCSNRMTDRTRDMVACLAQYTVVALDLAGDPTFAELAGRAGAAMLTAYRYGHYDFQAMKALEREHAQRRGLSFSQPAGLNLKRYTDPMPARGEPGPPPALPPAAGASVLAVDGACARGVVLLTIKPEAGSTVLELMCDGQAMAAGDMTALVEGIQAYAAAAVEDPGVRLSEVAAACGVRPHALGPDWVLVDNCWVDLRQVERALEPTPASAFVSDGSLVVSVPPGAPAAVVRERVLQAAQRGLPVIAPHRVVIDGSPAAGSPAPASQRRAWT